MTPSSGPSWKCILKQPPLLPNSPDDSNAALLSAAPIAVQPSPLPQFTFTPSSAGNITLPATNNPRQTSGVVFKTSSLSIAPNSVLDVTNNDLIIGNSDLATISNDILNGFGVGAGGAQITSSTALADGNEFLVPIDATALGVTSWDNVAVTDPNTIIVKFTYFGDANLDGLVDGNDFSVIAGSYRTTTPGLSSIERSWLMGDMNIDGFVDGNDFSTIAGTYGSTLLMVPSSNSVASADVPEPASLAFLACSLPLWARRKRA